ncbi:MAG: hypothetical protein IJX47_04290, partial [Clostridia bacterium]|nr:hypothetical protein [Clostridia bacterium]
NCTHKGDCRGTCPKCEAEVLTLERELARRRALGKRIAVVGLSAGIITTATACSDPTPIEHTAQTTSDWFDTGRELGGAIVVTPEILDGDVAISYYTSDFAACEPVGYVAERILYLEHLQDFDYSDGSVWAIPEGEPFAVIGTRKDGGMVLVLYGGQQFVMWEDDLPQSETAK